MAEMEGPAPSHGSGGREAGGGVVPVNNAKSFVFAFGVCQQYHFRAPNLHQEAHPI